MPQAMWINWTSHTYLVGLNCYTPLEDELEVSIQPSISPSVYLTGSRHNKSDDYQIIEILSYHGK